MPLRDHFRPPVSARKGWSGIHAGWSVEIAKRLNRGVLPKRYECEPEAKHGTTVEIDVAKYHDEPADLPEFGTNGHGGTAVAVATQTYTAPAAVATGVVSFVEEDVFEVRVYKDEGGFRLVAAIELVSPSNKDREAHREAFLAKCQSYLQQGVGLVIVDIVTTRAANFHDALLARLDPAARASGAGLYAASFRPVERQGETQLDVWCEPMAVGSPLPESPLWLRRACCLPVALQATYDRTCRAQRID